MNASLRSRSGQGHDFRSRQIWANLLGSEVETTADLSLLMPNPEISDKTLMRDRAGEIGHRGRCESEIVRESEQPNSMYLGKEVEERVVSNDEEEGRQGAALFDTPYYVDPIK